MIKVLWTVLLLDFITRHIDVRTCIPNSEDRGQLIAVGVVDILPHCVSSVYFFYDPAYTAWELGKVSALVEIQLARSLQATTLPDLSWYYLGRLPHWAYSQAIIYIHAKKCGTKAPSSLPSFLIRWTTNGTL